MVLWVWLVVYFHGKWKVLESFVEGNVIEDYVEIKDRKIREN